MLLLFSLSVTLPLYLVYTDFNQGVKLTDLTIGSGVSGYKNMNMDDFGIGKEYSA